MSGELRLDLRVGRRVRVEVLVELPEAVEALEGDVEGPFGDLARVDAPLG